MAKCEYVAIRWWPRAYHVYDGDRRLGVVNAHTVRHALRGLNGQIQREVWFAHNEHFFSIRNKDINSLEFPDRDTAAAAIPTGPIHHDIEAIS